MILYNHIYFFSLYTTYLLVNEFLYLIKYVIISTYFNIWDVAGTSESQEEGVLVNVNGFHKSLTPEGILYCIILFYFILKVTWLCWNLCKHQRGRLNIKHTSSSTTTAPSLPSPTPQWQRQRQWPHQWRYPSMQEST